MPRWPLFGRADTSLTGKSTLGQPESGIRNITEWAKKRACWSSVIRQQVEYGPALEDHLIDPQEFRAAERDGRLAAAEISSIEAQAKVIELGADFCERLRVWAAPNRVFSLKDDGILKACSQQERRLPSERQCLLAVDILARAREEGCLDDEEAPRIRITGRARAH